MVFVGPLAESFTGAELLCPWVVGTQKLRKAAAVGLPWGLVPEFGPKLRTLGPSGSWHGPRRLLGLK